MVDLRSRLVPDPDLHITTDGLDVYPWAIFGAFKGDVNHTAIAKSVDKDGNVTSEKVIGIGAPDTDEAGTSYVERHNLTMRMSMRRYTRETNGWSKKVANHKHMLSLFFVWYNWVRPHLTLEGNTPAIAAGLAEEVYGFDWIVGLIDERAPKPKRPKTYRRSKIAWTR